MKQAVSFKETLIVGQQNIGRAKFRAKPFKRCIC
jgi:hypothetical protein